MSSSHQQNLEKQTHTHNTPSSIIADCMETNTQTYTHTHTPKHTNELSPTNHIHTHTHTHTHTYTHIHTHTHTHTQQSYPPSMHPTSRIPSTADWSELFTTNLIVLALAGAFQLAICMPLGLYATTISKAVSAFSCSFTLRWVARRTLMPFTSTK